MPEKEERPEHKKRYERKDGESSGLGKDEHRPPRVEGRIGRVGELPDDWAIELACDIMSVSHEVAGRTE